ncbi:MAG: site-specific integrase [Bacteroidota bacterium]
MNPKADTFNVIFHLRNIETKEDLFAVYARITINGKRIEISVKHTILAEDWNEKRGVAKAVKEECKLLNNYLEQLRASYVACYREMTLQKKEITVETFKKAYYGEDEEAFTLKKLMHYHNVEMKEALSWGTMKNYYTTQKYLEKFLKEKLRVNDIRLTDISYSFITAFDYYLKTYKPTDHQKKLGNNGLMKHMERFRKMINVALKNEWIEKDPFRSYKLKFIKFERGYLTEAELKTLEEKEFEIERLQAVKDLFIFSCYTGLAYIDTVSLKPANIVTGMDQHKWILTKRKKTHSPVKVPLLPKAIVIIEKYRNNPKCIADGSLLPNMSNQKLNGYLKELADISGIKKNLTFHLARHTFATTVTLSNGVPIESVSKMLGHSRISTTQVYAKVIEQKLSDDMFLLMQKLEQKANATK